MVQPKGTIYGPWLKIIGNVYIFWSFFMRTSHLFHPPENNLCTVIFPDHLVPAASMDPIDSSGAYFIILTPKTRALEQVEIMQCFPYVYTIE